MWLRHWGLSRDPFRKDFRRALSASYSPTRAHDEVVARLTHVIESINRSALFIAPAGMGKSTLMDRVIQQTRSPARRIARVLCPGDGVSLFASIAESLGKPIPANADRSLLWRTLVESARLCRFQGLHLILIVDGCDLLTSPEDRRDLDCLDYLDPDPSARITVIRVSRNEFDSSSTSLASDWRTLIRLDPLTRTEAGDYLDHRLAGAGRPSPTFTPRALTRLHALSGGVPRMLNQLAHQALVTGALRGLEIVPPELIEGSAHESVRNPLLVNTGC